MDINSFNSKVNLPRLVALLGRRPEDYEFIRLPIFGWMARHKTEDFVGRTHDFFELADWPNLYTTIVNDYSSALDYKIPNSEYASRKLFNNYTVLMQYQAMWIMAKEELQMHRVRHDGRVATIREILEEEGMPALVTNEFGYLSETVINTFPRLGLEKLLRYTKNLVIPSFCSPKHICSVEYAPMQYIGSQRKTLYVNGEFGWYGKINTQILKDINELKFREGNTWDYKCDYWNNRVLQISENVDTEKLIRIWSESNRTMFYESPVDLIVQRDEQDNIKNHVSLLNYTQITELEKKADIKLLDYWTKAKEMQFTINNRTFVKRGNAFFLIVHNEEEQITNFALEITEIKKRINAKNEEEFYWTGFIYFGDDVVPFEMQDRFFVSCYLFSRGIRSQFLSLGLGIPFINEKYVRQLLTMIQLTCQNVKIVAEA